MTTPPKHLIDAVDAFAAKYGRNWKSRLRSFWFRGVFVGPELQQVRNAYLPWLRTYKPGQAMLHREIEHLEGELA